MSCYVREREFFALTVIRGIILSQEGNSYHGQEIPVTGKGIPVREIEFKE